MNSRAINSHALKHGIFVLASILTLALPATTLAQGVWRCGADGRSYSDSPCTGGRAVDLGAARSAADAAAAREDTQRQLAWAQASRAERERTETRLLATSTVPANMGPEPKMAAASRAKNPKSGVKSGSKSNGTLLRRQAKQALELGPEVGGTSRATVLASR